MNVYTVHLKGSPYDAAALERSIFVREGFAWAAFFFGPLWLLWHRLWLALLAWLVLEAALIAWSVLAAPEHMAIAALQALMHLALGFEGGQLRRGKLARRRFAMVGVVHGRRIADAEQAFFRRAVGAQTSAPDENASTPPAGARAPDMIGLFPSAGARS